MQNAKVCLAPLRFGAGLKGKLVDAMQNGTPSIMTSIAAEGMFGDFEPNGYIEDESEFFADNAVRLYQDKTLWSAFQENGFKIINNHFNKQRFASNFKNHIKSLINQLLEHRSKNFIGQMLQHHQLQSTKYMSKWIEEKNKRN